MLFKVFLKNVLVSNDLFTSHLSLFIKKIDFNVNITFIFGRKKMEKVRFIYIKIPNTSNEGND